MKVKTKYLLTIVLFMAIICIIPNIAKATTYMSGDYSYTVSNKKAKITGYEGSDSEVSIPSKLGKYSVAEIGYQAFKDCQEIETISIPATIEKIDEYAFSGCNFTTVKFSAKCKITTFNGFKNMSNLTSINIPNNVKTIGSRALEDNKNLGKITIPASVKEIQYCAFSDCTGLSTINIPTNVSKIDEYAFSGCNFTTVKFADNCKITQFSGFRDMSKLTSINIPKNVKIIKSHALENNKNLKTIIIPESVVEVEYCAFSNCTGLTTITIPRRVEKVDRYAFSGCEFTTVKFANDCMITEFPSFADMKTLTKVNIPRSVTKIDSHQLRNCTGLSEVIIPYGVTEIGYSAFSGCSNITVTIPSTVKTIDEYAFSDISNLRIKCESGSYAQTYCKNKGINYTTVSLSKPSTPINIKKCSISGYEAKPYTGKAITASLKVKYGKSTLTYGTDYIAEYSNNVNIGTAKITIVGFGKYIGKVEKSFKIIPAKVTGVTASGNKTTSLTIKWKKNSGKISGYRVYLYNSSNKSYKQIGTTSGTSYTIKKLKPGTTYKYAIKAYSTNSGTTYVSKAYSSIVTTATKPETPKITGLTTKSKKANLKWKKVSGASGYEVYMSTSKNGKYSKIKTVSKGSTVKYTKSKLKKNKKYYFKIRAYKTVGDKKIYSSYSGIKNIKVK